MRSTIALFSSGRRHGNTGRFIDRVSATLGIETIDLASLNLAPFDYLHRNRSDDFEPLVRQVLHHEQIIFATPIYWYAVSPAMKIFLDRISDLLELPDLLEAGRRLRGKTAYVVCTSVDDVPSRQFIDAFTETFAYLGMRFGGTAHVNCQDGYRASVHDPVAEAFARRVRDAPAVP
jgi:multimeric flavodoxin WrbA